jgi:PBP1b-binding outer membrane lipoprotein LpoB
MHFARKSIVMSMAGAAMLLGGCASQEDVRHAQATADDALAAAHHAQQTADQALSAAQTAQQGVDQLRQQQQQPPAPVHRGPKG